MLGKIFKQIGFHRLEDDLFRHLVITRLVYPVSKLKTVHYLYKYKGINITVDSVYRYLDKLHQDHIRLIQDISYEHARRIMPSEVSIAFYDVTTLYFEAIEKTFRISKSDLRVRPIFHHLKRRIETHICIAFAACVVYRKLERQLKSKKSLLSPENVIDILNTIYSLTIVTPYSKTSCTRLIIKKEEQKALLNLFEINSDIS